MRTTVLKQKKAITCKDDIEEPYKICTATMIILKDKLFYDFQMQFDFVIGAKETRVAGIFRYKDIFNFYMMEFSDSEVRMRRIMNGDSQIVKTVKMDLNPYAWYGCRIISR